MDNVVLDMKLMTTAGPVKVECHRNDGKVYCKILDVASHKQIADFIVCEDLVMSVPEIIKLYVRPV